MKILKNVLLGILGLILLLLIIAIFVKKDYQVEREVVINKPINTVFDYVKLLRNQHDYGVWLKMDPNAKLTFSGIDGTVGFISAWESEKKEVGSGEQEIKAIQPNERIDYELRFKKPMECTNFAYMTTESISADQTKVKWGFKGKMNYPMNLMRICMDMDKMMGKDFRTGLDNLKVILEH